MPNNHQPLITIVTVVYNSEKFIEETILNVDSQDYLNKEFIIVDGGSTDKTIEIIERNKNKISFFLSEPDLGIYDAMNKGVKHSKGEWIIFMNSGDVFANNKVISSFFTTSGHLNFELIYGNTLVKNKKKIVPPSIIQPNFFFFETICHQSIFINKKVFQKVGLHNLNFKIISDREFLLRASIENFKFKYFDIDVCFWESDGFSLQNSFLIEDEVRQLRKKYFKKIDILVLKIKYLISLLKMKIMHF